METNLGVVSSDRREVPQKVSSSQYAASRLASRIGHGREPAAVEFTPSLAKVLDLANGVTTVVVGPFGAGKTLLVEELELAALQRRSPGDPVAMRLSLKTWRSGTPIATWVAECLVRDFAVSHLAATALVEEGLVHPLIDGVDELASGLLPEFLDAVHDLPYPVLLTSRPIDLGQRFPVVELEPPPMHARLYRWSTIVEAMRVNPSAPVAIALNDPVNRIVFESVYAEVDTDPSLLLDVSEFPDARSVQRYLIEEVDAAMVGKLRLLSHYARTSDGGRVTWWRLADSFPRWWFLVLALLIGVTGGLTVTLSSPSVLDELTDYSFPYVAHVVTGVVMGMGLALCLFPTDQSRHPVAVDWKQRGPSTVAWLIAGTAVGVAGGVAGLYLGFGPTFLACELAAGLGAGLLGALSTLVVIRDSDCSDEPLWALRQDRNIALFRFLTTFISADLALIAVPGLAASTQTGIIVASLLASGLVLLRSAYVRYKIAGWLPKVSGSLGDTVYIMAAVPELTRREGGIFLFRDESVRAQLKVFPLEQAYLSPVTSATVQVRKMSRELADEACRRLDVAGVLEQDQVLNFMEAVAREINRNAVGIAASTAVMRRKYVAAKARYAESLFAMPLKVALWLGTITNSLLQFGAAFMAIAVTGLMPQWTGLTVPHESILTAVFATAIMLGGTTAVCLLVVWTLARLEGMSFLRLNDSPVVTILCVGISLVLAILASHPSYVRDGVVMAMATSGAVCWAMWVFTAWTRTQTRKLLTDDPTRWPAADITSRAFESRSRAEKALHNWREALLDRDVRPLVAARLAAVTTRSYDVVLPKADVRWLGDVTHVAQYVPTDTSRRLVRMMESRSRGAIGISGPRGVGKSTVVKMFGELGFGAQFDDLTMVVPAPTNYASREFLVHLYTRLCITVIGDDPESVVRVRRWPFLLVSLTGVLGAVGVWQWPLLIRAAAWVPSNWQTAAMMACAMVTLVPLLVLRRAAAPTRRRSAAQEAQRRLAGLRYLETTTLTRAASVKPPVMVEVGGTQALARTGQVKTFPELVSEFRSFLEFLTGGGSGARVIVGVDELDKIASAAEAERFLNDIKAVFGVEGTFFLVAVSDDALASFSRRSLAVRTAFDSAFDSVITVRRFELADTRRLLVQRVCRLPEPFVWLCHALSGGLPRDLNRTVRELYDVHTVNGEQNLGVLARELVRADLDAVVDGMSVRLAERFDGFAVELRQHILNVRRLELSSSALLGYRPLSGVACPEEELSLVYAQFRCYLMYAAAVLRAFDDNAAVVITALRITEAGPVQLLASARVWLATDPVAAAELVIDWCAFEDQTVNRPAHPAS